MMATLVVRKDKNPPLGGAMHASAGLGRAYAIQ